MQARRAEARRLGGSVVELAVERGVQARPLRRGRAAVVAIVVVGLALALVVDEPLLRVVLARRREPDLLGLDERALEHDVLLKVGRALEAVFLFSLDSNSWPWAMPRRVQACAEQIVRFFT